MGDFGTLFPLVVGYIAVCDLTPAGFLVMMEAANIATGLVYRLPMPLQPMEALAIMAIAQKWSPSMVYVSIVGAMMFMVRAELCKFAKDISFKKTDDIFPFTITAIISPFTNMAFGFAAGITFYHLLRFFIRR